MHACLALLSRSTSHYNFPFSSPLLHSFISFFLFVDAILTQLHTHNSSPYSHRAINPTRSTTS